MVTGKTSGSIWSAVCSSPSASPRGARLAERHGSPSLTKVVVEARQPHLSRDDRFRYGLERVLDCIGAAMADTSAS